MISIYQQGSTNNSTFCVQPAESGFEKWTTHLLEMIVTYLDKKESDRTSNQFRRRKQN